MQQLTQPYESWMSEYDNDGVPRYVEFSHVCKTKKIKNDYQPKKFADPDKIFSNIKPPKVVDDEEDIEDIKNPSNSKQKQNNNGVGGGAKNKIYQDIEEIKNKQDHIEKKLDAMISLINELVKDENGNSLLFKTAKKTLDSKKKSKCNVNKLPYTNDSYSF